MTRPLTLAPTISAPKVTKGAGVTPCACGGLRTQRERYTFTGRERHWGYTYLVWTRDDGKRWVRVMH